MDVLSKDKVERIRQLNDAFRSSFRGGKILLRASVAELPDMVKAAALHQVAQYKDSLKRTTQRDARLSEILVEQSQLHLLECRV